MNYSSFPRQGCRNLEMLIYTGKIASIPFGLLTDDDGYIQPGHHLSVPHPTTWTIATLPCWHGRKTTLILICWTLRQPSCLPEAQNRKGTEYGLVKK